MADTASKHIDMTTGSLWHNIPLFAFPVAATSILEQLSNLIATVIIGNFSGDQGTLAMAAVGSNVPLTSLMLNLFIGMSLGSNVVIANAIGRNDQNMVKRAVHTSILMALVGFVVIALGEIFAEPMLAALNGQAAAYIAATPRSPRALPAAELGDYLKRFGKPVTVCADPAQAAELALAHAAPEEVICAVGSLYMAGAIRMDLRRDHNENSGH